MRRITELRFSSRADSTYGFRVDQIPVHSIAQMKPYAKIELPLPDYLPHAQRDICVTLKKFMKND